MRPVDLKDKNEINNHIYEQKRLSVDGARKQNMKKKSNKKSNPAPAIKDKSKQIMGRVFESFNINESKTRKNSNSRSKRRQSKYRPSIFPI